MFVQVILSLLQNVWLEFFEMLSSIFIIIVNCCCSVGQGPAHWTSHAGQTWEKLLVAALVERARNPLVEQWHPCVVGIRSIVLLVEDAVQEILIYVIIDTNPAMMTSCVILALSATIRLKDGVVNEGCAIIKSMCITSLILNTSSSCVHRTNMESDSQISAFQSEMHGLLLLGRYVAFSAFM